MYQRQQQELHRWRKGERHAETCACTFELSCSALARTGERQPRAGRDSGGTWSGVAGVNPLRCSCCRPCCSVGTAAVPDPEAPGWPSRPGAASARGSSPAAGVRAGTAHACVAPLHTRETAGLSKPGTQSTLARQSRSEKSSRSITSHFLQAYASSANARRAAPAASRLLALQRWFAAHKAEVHVRLS